MPDRHKIAGSQPARGRFASVMVSRGG